MAAFSVAFAAWAGCGGDDGIAEGHQVVTRLSVVQHGVEAALQDMGVPEGDVNDVISLTSVRLWNLRARCVGSTFGAFVRYAVRLAIALISQHTLSDRSVWYLSLAVP